MDRFDLLQGVYNTLLALTCIVAFWRGHAPERVGGAIMLLGTLVTYAAAAVVGSEVRSTEIGILQVDLVVLATLVVLVLRSDRFWPLWVCGFHLVGVTTHVAMFFYPTILPVAYRLVQGAWAYPMMLAIVIGALDPWRARRTNGTA